MGLLQRFYDAVVRNRKRTEKELEATLREALAYPERSSRDMDKLIKKILEITDGEK